MRARNIKMGLKMEKSAQLNKIHFSFHKTFDKYIFKILKIKIKRGNYCKCSSWAMTGLLTRGEQMICSKKGTCVFYERCPLIPLRITTVSRITILSTINPCSWKLCFNNTSLSLALPSANSRKHRFYGSKFNVSLFSHIDYWLYAMLILYFQPLTIISSRYAGEQLS